MSEPKPMDPAELDELRRTTAPVTHPSFTKLLADRDYWRDRERRLVVVLERIAGAHELDPIGYAGVALDALGVRSDA